MSPLHRVLERIRAVAARARGLPVTVFDLDSTLFSTQERNWAILREFVAERAAERAELAQVVERIRFEEMGWNVMDDLRRRGFRDSRTLKELRGFWFRRFFQSRYLHHDVPVPGAREYVREAHDAGALVYYLTGRDEPNMGDGTRASLRTHDFPLDGERAILRLKPRFDDQDLAFKRSVVGELRALGEVVAAFENEPANANLFAEEFPAAEVIFVDTVCSPDPPPLAPRVVRVKDFRRS